VQRQAWHWALTSRAGDGSLPDGSEIAYQFGLAHRGALPVNRQLVTTSAVWVFGVGVHIRPILGVLNLLLVDSSATGCAG
jgi:hypothetical protein